jgi:hypothetical protein
MYERIICELCGTEVSLKNLKRHQETCNKYKDRLDFKCIYCQKQCKNINSLAQHEVRCKHNPDRQQVKPSYGMLR